MVLPERKQQEVQLLYNQGVSIHQIAKTLKTTRPTVRKYLGLVSQSQPSQQVQQMPAIPIYDRQPQPSFRGNKRYLDPDIERMYDNLSREEHQRDTRENFRRGQGDGYQRPIPTRDDNYAHPIRSEPPLPPEPLNIYEQELANLRNRKGIPVENTSMDKWINYNKELQIQSQIDFKNAQDRAIEEKKEKEHQERMKELTKIVIDIELQNKQNQDFVIEQITKLKQERNKQPIRESKPEPEYIPPVPVLKYSDVKHLITGNISDYDLRDKVVPDEQEKVMDDHRDYMYNKREPRTPEEQAEEDETNE